MKQLAHVHDKIYTVKGFEKERHSIFRGMQLLIGLMDSTRSLVVSHHMANCIAERMQGKLYGLKRLPWWCTTWCESECAREVDLYVSVWGVTHGSDAGGGSCLTAPLSSQTDSYRFISQSHFHSYYVARYHARHFILLRIEYRIWIRQIVDSSVVNKKQRVVQSVKI